MIVISHEFVCKWSMKYDKRTRYGTAKEAQVEKEIREWLEKQPKPKCLDKEHFVKLGCWKARRQKNNYKLNAETEVQKVTRLVSQESNDLQKLRTLKRLKGVGVAVASTILHFMYPHKFPIFDVRVRSSLKKAGLWNRGVNYVSDKAWLEYVCIMQKLSVSLGVTLRELDKALWAYDKFGGRDCE